MRNTARRLRANQTEAEKRLWQAVRDRRLGGDKFRRQHPVGPYIADFVCTEKGLIIELDGGQHAERKVYDAERTRYLEETGYTVIRFWNNEVLQNTEGVLETILRELSQMDTPSP